MKLVSGWGVEDGNYDKRRCPCYGRQCARNTGGTSLGYLSHSCLSALRDLSGSCLGCVCGPSTQESARHVAVAELLEVI